MVMATISLRLSRVSLQLEKQIHWCCACGFFPGFLPLEKQTSAKKYLHSEKHPVPFPYISPFLRSSVRAHLLMYYPLVSGNIQQFFNAIEIPSDF